jgi:hypothetical protein
VNGGGFFVSAGVSPDHHDGDRNPPFVVLPNHQFIVSAKHPSRSPA